MKLSTLLLSMMSLTLLHEAVSTHLQTCECHEIRDLVNITVQEAVAGLEDRLTRLLNINTTDSSTLETRLTTTMKQLLKPIKQQLDYHLPPPSLLGTKDNQLTHVKSCTSLVLKLLLATIGLNSLLGLL